jgi:hypothetical protein
MESPSKEQFRISESGGGKVADNLPESDDGTYVTPQLAKEFTIGECRKSGGLE